MNKMKRKKSYFKSYKIEHHKSVARGEGEFRNNFYQKRKRFTSSEKNYLLSFHLFTGLHFYVKKNISTYFVQHERLNKKNHTKRMGIEPISFNSRLNILSLNYPFVILDT